MDIHSREIYVSRNVIFYETSLCNLKDKNGQLVTQEGNDFLKYLHDNTTQLEVESHVEDKD